MALTSLPAQRAQLAQRWSQPGGLADNPRFISVPKGQFRNTPQYVAQAYAHRNNIRRADFIQPYYFVNRTHVSRHEKFQRLKAPEE